jgi:hypothetical protein
MSICECGQVSVPLGKVSVQVFGTIHGVTACGPSDRHWKDRAEQAEAAIARVRGIVDADQTVPIDARDPASYVAGYADATFRVRQVLDGGQR